MFLQGFALSVRSSLSLTCPEFTVVWYIMSLYYSKDGARLIYTLIVPLPFVYICKRKSVLERVAFACHLYLSFEQLSPHSIRQGAITKWGGISIGGRTEQYIIGNDNEAKKLYKRDTKTTCRSLHCIHWQLFSYNTNIYLAR